MKYSQKTIINPVQCVGVGLHSGDEVHMKMLPAESDTGIIFRVVQNGKEIDISAKYDAVSSTILNTTISASDSKYSVSTVEHLMAALWGCDIDNIIIEIDGNEVPIMDGSSDHFVFMLESAGIKNLHANRKVIEILKTVKVQHGKAFASLSPSKTFSVSMEVDFEHSALSSQKKHFMPEDSSFKLDLSRARTFGFENDISKLQEIGLVKGGSLDNAIVIGKEKVLNAEGFRYDDELVRHKILDALGDLYLAGTNLIGSFSGYRSGHALNNSLLRELFADKEAWRYVSG